MIPGVEMHVFDRLLSLIVAVYFFLFIGSFLDLLDSWKKGRSKKDDR